MENSSNGIRKEQSKSPIMVSRVYADQFRAGLMVAELKQTVTTKSYYPSKSVASNLSDNPFGASDFGFGETEFESTETRVAWISVPEGTTKEAVEAKLAQLPEATLYRILSNNPILTDGQKYAIDSPDIDLTLDKVAEGQAIRLPEGVEGAGNLALDKAGKIQYRSVFFKASACSDVDARTEDGTMYLSEGLKAEINGVATIPGQEL